MPSQSDPNVSTYVQSCFEKAFVGFPDLQSHDIRLRQRPLKNMTTRAQPRINRNFFYKEDRSFVVDIQDHTVVKPQIAVDDLSEKVLVGWFAHELGHVMDYLNRSWANMIRFGVGYLLFPTFRLGAERKADLFAIENGFAEEITATKCFLLEASHLPDSYRNRLMKYYMSPEEVEIINNKLNEGTVFRDRII